MSDYSTVRMGGTLATVLCKPPPPAVYEWISASAFWDRFTNAELVDYEVAMQHDISASNAVKKTAAKLRIFRRELSDAKRIRLDKKKVADFVTSLEGSVLSVGRAAEILGAPITADEAGA